MLGKSSPNAIRTSLNTSKNKLGNFTLCKNMQEYKLEDIVNNYSSLKNQADVAAKVKK